MSANISKFPSKVPPPDDEKAAVSSRKLPKLAPPEVDRIERLVAIYEKIGHNPDLSRDQETMGAVVTALREGRERDADVLLDIALEGPDKSVINADGTGEEQGSPFPEVANVWRHKPRAPGLRLVSSEAGNISHAQSIKSLVPSLSMPAPLEGDWTLSAGDLEFDPVSHRATVELATKGEFFVALRAGAIAIKTSDGDQLVEVDCIDNEVVVVQVNYCGSRSRDDHAPVVLELVKLGEDLPQGIWAHSGRSELKSEQRRADPDTQDTYHVREFAPIAGPEDDKFSSDATLKVGGPRYMHREWEEAGAFVRFELKAGELSAHGEWELNDPSLETAVLGFTSAPEEVGNFTKTARHLVEHDGCLEMIVCLSGVTWVGLASRRAEGPADDRRYIKLGDEHACVMPLLADGEGAFDVMLLRSNYGHAVWTVPGSAARFLHFSFNDPNKIVPRQNKQARSQHADDASTKDASRRRMPERIRGR